jgi:hypothetical protein
MSPQNVPREAGGSKQVEVLTQDQITPAVRPVRRETRLKLSPAR